MTENNRFNLTRFNVSATSKDIWFARDYTEIIENVTGAKKVIDFARQFNESVHAQARMIATIPIMRRAEEAVLAYLTLRKLIHIADTFAESINGAAYAGKNMFARRDCDTEVFCNSYAGKYMHAVRESAETLAASVYAGKYCWFRPVTSEVIGCITIGSTTVYSTFVLNITLPPGGEVRINSDIFTAVAGLENILPDYDGGWVYLTRDTIQVNVDSGSGGDIFGEILYNERYI